MARTMRRFTDEQIERANRVDVVDFVKRQGLEYKKHGDWYNVKGLGGLYLKRSANTWHWESRDTGGKGAISLCMELENLSYPETIKYLLNEEMDEIRHGADWKPKPEAKQEFVLPKKNDTYKHVVAYLTKTRALDYGIVKEMINKGYIYENEMCSCVFVGKDSEGVARFASIRSTNTNGKSFKGDVGGGSKDYSFSLSGSSGRLIVCEAPIDILSYMSMQKHYGQAIEDSYLSLSGTSTKALEQFLKEHDNIEKICVATDNDEMLNPPAGKEEIFRMKIKKDKLVKETENLCIFKNLDDYSKFMDKNCNIPRQYIAFKKTDITLLEDKTYEVIIDSNKEYEAYQDKQNIGKKADSYIKGREVYSKHFFEMPAGEKAALNIKEKFGERYRITRHRPTHKDFNEDLIALKYPDRDVEKKNENQQSKETDAEPIQSGLKEINETDYLKELGAGEQVITWYGRLENKQDLHSKDFYIKGKCEVLYVCDDVKEMFSMLEEQMQAKEGLFGEQIPEDVMPDEYYVPYRGNKALQEFVSAHPDIKKIWTATSRTEAGEKAAAEIKQMFDGRYECKRFSPKLLKYSEDLARLGDIRKVLNQSPLDSLQQVDMAVGMEV